ncbi:MAG: DNA mismatch repair endonuclease MutL [Candidatus Dormibacteria bacterium]|jgi:DNA mismatch repair protein MutL
MTATIRLLPPQVADAIAAGEVVERPAAVVKELCENALDAGAGRVDVDVEGGGLVRIVVADDGAGIPGDQLRLAVARHATSKLATVDDLARVRSLGFRGEALASIAAVSDLHLTSRPAGSENGWLLRCRAGEVLEHRPAARAPGTTAEVRDLFHNTPARLAFLRAERSEAAAAVRAVSDLALAHPEVAFSCRSDDRLALRSPGGSLVDAATAVFGRDAGELLVVDAPGEIAVAGLIGEPRSHRGTRTGLVLVINGRRVHNRALVAAVEEAYAGLLPAGRHPFGVVQVTLDPTVVDVNVHPTKREVRLRDEGRVFSAVQRACWAALQEARLSVAGARLPQLAGVTGAGPIPGAEAEGAELELRDGPPSTPAAGLTTPWVELDRAARTGQRLIDLAPLRPLAQTAEGWLIADSPRGAVLVDPHAAHEKILYTELMGESEAATREGRPASSQLLLVDAVVSVDASALERLTESLDTLTGMGFDLEPFGPGLVRCRAVPAAVGPTAPERLVRDLLDSLQDPADPSTRRRRLAALTACHAAVRLGERLDVREQGRLLERLVATPGGLTCPHGRPTVVVLDSRSLRQAFGRPAV